jgi:hypothetical protein
MYIIYKTTCVVNGKIYIGQHKIKDSKTLEANFKGCKHSEETRNKMREKRRMRGGTKGWKMTEEQRRRLSEAHIGKQSKDKHPLWGKIFINNGVRNKTIRKGEEIPNGWFVGMIRHRVTK